MECDHPSYILFHLPVLLLAKMDHFLGYFGHLWMNITQVLKPLMRVHFDNQTLMQTYQQKGCKKVPLGHSRMIFNVNQ